MKQNKRVAITLDYRFRNIIISALRYALSRHTYIVDETCEWIEEHLHLLDDRTLNVMIRDTLDQIRYYENEGINPSNECDYRRLRAFYYCLLDYKDDQETFDNDDDVWYN